MRYRSLAQRREPQFDGDWKNNRRSNDGWRGSADGWDCCQPCRPCKPCVECKPCKPCQPCQPCKPCPPCKPCEFKIRPMKCNVRCDIECEPCKVSFGKDCGGCGDRRDYPVYYRGSAPGKRVGGRPNPIPTKKACCKSCV